MASYKFFNAAMKRKVSLQIFHVAFGKTFTRGSHIKRALNLTFKGRRVTTEEGLRRRLLKQAPNIEDPITEIPKTLWKDTDDNDFFGIHSDSGVIIIPPETVKTTKSGIEKFGFLLKSKTSSDDGDRTFMTKFGTVRFDSDNQPSHSKSNIEVSTWEDIGGPNSIKKFYSLFYPKGQISDEFQSLSADIDQNSRQLSPEVHEVDTDECHSEVLRSDIDRPNFMKDEVSEMSQEDNNVQSSIDICNFGNKFQDIKEENIDIKETAAIENQSTPASDNTFQGVSETGNFIEDIYFKNNATGPKMDENDGHVEICSQTKYEKQSYIDDIYFEELYNSKTYEDLNNRSKENEIVDAGIFKSAFDFQSKNCDINKFPNEIKDQNFVDAVYFGEHGKEMPNTDFEAKIAITEKNVIEHSNLAGHKSDEPFTSNLSAAGIQSFLKESEDEADFRDNISSQTRRSKFPLISENSSSKPLPVFDRQVTKSSKHLKDIEREKYAFSVRERLKSSKLDNEEEQYVENRSLFNETDNINHTPSNITSTVGVSQISNATNLRTSLQTLKSVKKMKSSKNTIPKDTIESSNTSVNSRSNCKNQDSAYNYVLRLKNNNKTTASNGDKGVFNNVNISGEKLDSKGFRILRSQAPDLTNHTRLELLDMMKERVLFLNDDIVILDKPYSLIMHESQTTKTPSLSSFLGEFARQLDKSSENPQLYTVHRLDKETSGCLLLARNEKSAQYLKSLFANRKISKIYWVVTSKVPEPLEGIIDMPITGGKIDGKRRMVLQPDLSADIKYKSHVHNGKRAITNYKVIATSGNAALIEVKPETGLKHQIRVHLGFGMGCPIIGDHKYSCLTKLAPQKLPNDILQMLHVRQSKVRYIPMHIHAKAIVIPDYFEKGRDLYITAPMPKHMRENIKRLKLNET